MIIIFSFYSLNNANIKSDILGIFLLQINKIQIRLPAHNICYVIEFIFLQIKHIKGTSYETKFGVKAF